VTSVSTMHSSLVTISYFSVSADASCVDLDVWMEAGRTSGSILLRQVEIIGSR
jgi:hypothetical protein